MKRALALLTLGFLLTACGQKGPLYLPDNLQPAGFSTDQGGVGG